MLFQGIKVGIMNVLGQHKKNKNKSKRSSSEMSVSLIICINSLFIIYLHFIISECVWNHIKSNNLIQSNWMNSTEIVKVK